MKLPQHFRIEITGDSALFVQRQSVGGFAYLIERLLSGEEVAESEFESWGLSVVPAVDLRDLTEDDVALALSEGCMVELPLTTHAEVLEAVNCVLDAKLGRDE